MILGADWVVPVDGPPIADGRVEIVEGRIVRLGQGGPADEAFPNSLILPGLVNAHSHLEYARMSGFGDGKPFTPWIEEHIRRKAALDHPADSLVQAIDGARACLAGGITTIADCCYAGTVAEAAVATGLRAIVYVEGFSDWPDLAGRVEATLDRLPESPLVTAGVSPHAPFTVTHEDYELLIGIARRRGLPVATHILESQRETLHLEDFEELLGPDTVLIHGVFLNPQDIATAAELDLPVVHCPRSNALLGCGIAPLRELLDAGLRVGLGTDSPASAMVFDMWEEMRFAVMAARARGGSADALSAADALDLATRGAARAIGLGDRVGTLAEGMTADLTVLDLTGSPFLPWGDPVVAAVFGGSPNRVAISLVNGEIRYRRGESMPTTEEADAVRAKMLLA
ncbi:MAG TPA: amidohydrolase family protein [Gaiellales bacterium]|nr:amidohydrolase family protein [Gaiellales bacterium]